MTSQIELAPVPDIQRIQDNNLKLFEQTGHLTYGGEADNAGYFCVDVLNADKFSEISAKVRNIFNFDDIKHLTYADKTNKNVELTPDQERKLRDREVFERYKIEIQFTESPKIMVVNARSNVRNFPIQIDDPHKVKNNKGEEVPMYLGNPYLYSFTNEGYYLDNGDAIYSGQPVMVLANARLKSKGAEGEEEELEYVYVRGSHEEGWMKLDDLISYKEGDFVIDTLRPVDNIARVEARKHRLGVITAQGLKIEGIQLTRTDKFKANANVDGIPDPNKSYENWGDGILETGESAVLSLGDAVEIIGEIASEYIIMLPAGNVYYVEKSAVNLGYLAPTQENYEKLAAERRDEPYSWGAKDGMGPDCSDHTKKTMAAFGIAVAGRGGIPQMLGREGHQWTIAERKNAEQDWRDFLPRNIGELALAIGDGAMDNFPWGFATVSWGTHVMIIAGYDPDTGELLYDHSVGPAKTMARKIDEIETVGIFKTLRSTAVFNRMVDGHETALTFSPSLASQGAKISLVTYI